MLVDCRGPYHIPDMRHPCILSQAYRICGKQFWNPMVIRIVQMSSLSKGSASGIVVFLKQLNSWTYMADRVFIFIFFPNNSKSTGSSTNLLRSKSVFLDQKNTGFSMFFPYDLWSDVDAPNLRWLQWYFEISTSQDPPRPHPDWWRNLTQFFPSCWLTYNRTVGNPPNKNGSIGKNKIKIVTNHHTPAILGYFAGICT